MRQAYIFIKTLLTTPYSTFGIVVLSLTIALSGCSETSSGGSGFTDVGRDEPTIVDSVLAISVFEDRPDGITTTFSAGVNDRLFYGSYGQNITEHHTVKVSWFSPEDDLDDPPFWTEKKPSHQQQAIKLRGFTSTCQTLHDGSLKSLMRPFERSHVRGIANF